MERLSMIEIDKNTKRLIIFDLYLLFSLVSIGIIYEIFKDIIQIETSVIIGLVVGLVATFYFMKFIKVLSKHKSVSNNG